jgi:hypothetical protein
MGHSEFSIALSEFEAILICGICLNPLEEPKSISGCRHTFCRDCIVPWLGNNSQCPICMFPGRPKDLRNNNIYKTLSVHILTIKSLIEKPSDRIVAETQTSNVPLYDPGYWTDQGTLNILHDSVSESNRKKKKISLSNINETLDMLLSRRKITPGTVFSLFDCTSTLRKCGRLRDSLDGDSYSLSAWIKLICRIVHRPCSSAITMVKVGNDCLIDIIYK